MPYSTIEDLKGLLPEKTLIKISNDQGGATELDMTNVDKAIAQGDRLIDGYVGLQKEVPLSPVPGLISVMSAQFAVYFLYRRRNQVPDIWQSQYKADVAVLVKMGEGKISLGAADKPVAAPEKVLAHSSGKVMSGAGGLLEKF